MSASNMKAINKLSQTQQDALSKLNEHGKIIRKPGGFWTFPGCDLNPRNAPTWWVDVRTIRCLVRQGLAVETDFVENKWCVGVSKVEAAQ